MFHWITSSAVAEGFGGLEVDDQFELGRLHNRQLGGSLAPEDAVDVAGREPELVGYIGPVGDQAAVDCVVVEGVGRRPHHGGRCDVAARARPVVDHELLAPTAMCRSGAR
jgi:hypothetical protein